MHTSSVDDEVAPARSRAVEILGAAHSAAQRCDREDLVERLEAAQERMRLAEVTVLVVGEFKQGKSSLVNALVNADVCPVDDDVATAVATVIRHAEASEATVTYDPPPGPEGPSDIGDAVTSPIRVEDASAYVVSGRIADSEQRVRSVEIGIPRKLLASGLRFVDTPGVGGLESAHGMATMGALGMADAVFFVTDSSQELTQSELNFVELACSRSPHVYCVMPKIDFYPQWRKIRELNEGHLADAGLDVEILAVSSELRRRSVTGRDRQLNLESGFPALLARLRDKIVSDAEMTTIRGCMADVRSCLAQLQQAEQAERDVLADPDARAGLIAEAENAKRTAERMRSAAARWSVTLNDGIADLTSDIDHDMRTRTRELLAEIHDLVDDNDPTDVVDELFPMVEQRLMADVAENYERMRNQASELSIRVLDLFENDSPAGDVPDVLAPTDLLEGVGSIEVELADRPTLRENVLSGMRGSYGGVMMFGMLGSVVGLATFGPLSVAAGALLGRKAARDERQRQLTLRRQQAKQGIKKYFDEVTFRVNKHSRDTLRQIQRDLRDANNARSQELSRTANEAQKAASAAVQTDEKERERRLNDLDASLDQMRRIDAAAEALVT